MISKNTNHAKKMQRAREISFSNEYKGANEIERTAFLLMSYKGGVGKTTLCMTLIEYLRFHLKINVLAIDADSENYSLSQRYALKGRDGDFLENLDQLDEGVVQVPECTKEGFKTILQALRAQDARHAVIDFGGGDVSTFQSLFATDDSLERQFKKYGFRLVVIIPFDNQPNQMDSVGTVIGALGDWAQYVIIQNPKMSGNNAQLDEHFKSVCKSYASNIIALTGSHLDSACQECLSKHTTKKFNEIPEVAEIDDVSGHGDPTASDYMYAYLVDQKIMWASLFKFLEGKSVAVPLPHHEEGVIESKSMDHLQVSNVKKKDSK